MPTHDLGFGHGSLIENIETGQVTYRATGKIIPAFTVRIADVIGISTQRKGFLTVMMRVNGQGTVLAECEVNHGTGYIIRKWFDLKRDISVQMVNSESVSQITNQSSHLGDQLAKLAELHRIGALSESEFSDAKQKLIGARD